MTQTQYFKHLPVVSSQEQQHSAAAGSHYTNKRSSYGTEIVCFSFGLISVLLRQKLSSERCKFSALLREFLNKLDLSVVCGDEKNDVLCERLRASWHLKMPFRTPLNKLPKTPLSVVMTPPNSVPKVHSLFLQT